MTIVEQIADFAAKTTLGDLPPEIVEEIRRIILDSVGCALAGVDDEKGRIGIAVADSLGGHASEATILGVGRRSSVLGAAFANGELINALDMDAVLPPGHVAPYVIPAALAQAEQRGASGGDLVVGVAIAHELSNRIGKAMDYLRDIRNGQIDPPRVYGYSSTIFGAVCAILKVKGASADVIAHSLGIAGCTAPVNSHMAWVHHQPSTTVKYTVAGVMVQSALTAALLGEGGHRGDLQVLDDAQYGFPAMIGTRRWAPEAITRDLGGVWGFLPQSSFKPYPYCRVLHTAFDVMRRLQDQHDLNPGEIDSILVQGEAFLERPIWENDRIERVADAQFSLRHGIAVAAHRIPPGKAWQSAETIHAPSVMRLMQRVRHEAHPGYLEAIMKNPESRKTRVEIHARGRVFEGEQLYPPGSPSPDPASRMTTEALVAKFLHNGAEVMTPAALEDAVDLLLHLERQPDIAAVMSLFVRGMKPKVGGA